jgi:hypothetical protein
LPWNREEEGDSEANCLQAQETKEEAQDTSQAASGLPGLSPRKKAYPGWKKRKKWGKRVRKKGVAQLFAGL